MPKNKQTAIKNVLFGYIKRLSKRKKYLKIIFSSYAFLEDDQHFLQKLSQKTKSNISTPKLRFFYGKTNNHTFYKMKTSTFSKKSYKIHQ